MEVHHFLILSFIKVLDLSESNILVSRSQIPRAHTHLVDIVVNYTCWLLYSHIVGHRLKWVLMILALQDVIAYYDLVHTNIKQSIHTNLSFRESEHQSYVLDIGGL